MAGEFDWYVVYTVPRREMATRDKLLRAGFEVYLPLGKKWIKPRHVKAEREVQVAIFPGYMFVAIEACPRWYQLLQVDGVGGILTNNERPVRARSELVDALRYAQDCGEFDQVRATAPDLIHRDASVTIIAGPLVGYEARVASFEQGQARAMVSVRMLGGVREVSVPVDLLRLLA